MAYMNRWRGDFDFLYTNWSTGGECEEEDELIQDVSRVIADLEAAKFEIESSLNNGIELEARTCPDSLMGPGDSCLDSYISSWSPYNFYPLGIGNSRSSDFYATRDQTKFFFVPKFDENKFHLIVGNSTLQTFIPLPGFPNKLLEWTVKENKWQVEKLVIDSVSATERLVSLKVSNAHCGAAMDALGGTGWLQGDGWIVAAACLSIDVQVRYQKVGANWNPVSYLRDAYPTLDVWQKDANGIPQRLLHSQERGILSGLTGIERLIGQIKQIKGRLQEDDDCFET